MITKQKTWEHQHSLIGELSKSIAGPNKTDSILIKEVIYLQAKRFY